MNFCGSTGGPNYNFKLYLQVSNENEVLKNLYTEKSLKPTTDSGFDLFIPENVTIEPKSSKFIDLQVRCEPRFEGGYYLYPRSSIGKTQLRQANSVGIIDSEYRGNLGVWIDNIGTEPHSLKMGERYFQLCHPSLLPMKVEVVDQINLCTSRGAGGFGSTGK